MIKKKYLTKKIWHEGQWWELLKVYSPSKYEDHLLLRRETNGVHEDGSSSWDYIIIMDGNDDWLPNTRQVRKLAWKYAQLMHAESPLMNAQNKLIEIRMKVWDDKPKEVKV